MCARHQTYHKKNEKNSLHVLEDETAHKEFNQEDEESIRKYPRGTRPRSFECGLSIVIQSVSSESFSLSSKTIFTV